MRYIHVACKGAYIPFLSFGPYKVVGNITSLPCIVGFLANAASDTPTVAAAALASAAISWLHRRFSSLLVTSTTKLFQLPIK
jgi:hypothetical protein